MNAREVKSIRRQLGLSRSRLAAALGVTYQSVYNWENGFFRPTALAVEKLREIKRGIPVTPIPATASRG